MIQNIFQAIKYFFENHSIHGVYEYMILGIVIIGGIIMAVLLIKWWIKQYNINKKKELENRKYEKKLLKFLSNKKNKTF